MSGYFDLPKPGEEFFKAFIQAQSKFDPVLRDRNNPAYRSRYATLESVLDAVLPALNQHGLAVLQPPVDRGDDSGRVTVVTIIVHESGQALQTAFTVLPARQDVQSVGSAITYARRYALLGTVCVAPEDDDGNAAALEQGGQRSGNVTPMPSSRPQLPAASAGEDLASALKRAKGISSLDKLNGARSWAKSKFNGEDLKKLLAAIDEREQELQMMAAATAQADPAGAPEDAQSAAG